MRGQPEGSGTVGFSALQRAEIAEIHSPRRTGELMQYGFSALQRAEIAEMRRSDGWRVEVAYVSVLFNEPKLLKWLHTSCCAPSG